MKDFSHINKEYTCAPLSVFERIGVLQHLKELGVSIYEETWNQKSNKDYKWPDIYWNHRAGYVASVKANEGINIVPISEFVALFEAPVLPKIGDRQPTIINNGKTLKVGCTEIPFEDVKAIYEAMAGEQDF